MKGQQSYVLLCTEITASKPPVVFFWVKYQKLLKVEIKEVQIQDFFKWIALVKKTYWKIKIALNPKTKVWLAGIWTHDPCIWRLVLYHWATKSSIFLGEKKFEHTITFCKDRLENSGPSN